MFRFKKTIAAFSLAAMISTAVLVVGYSPLQARSAKAEKEPNLYGLPIVHTFPDVPAVPEKIKAAKPSPQASDILKSVALKDKAEDDSFQAKSTEAKNKPNLYGLPIVLTFPDVPAVPEKIKAAKPSPQAGAVLKNIPSYVRPSTSDEPAAGKSR